MASFSVDGYKVGPEINRGGSAILYKAEDFKTQRTVALKVLLPEARKDSGMVKAFKNEAAILSEIEHEGLLQVFSSGETSDGAPYMAMEFFAGKNLKNMILQKDRRLETAWLAIAEEISDALLYLHTQDIIHKDVKPENILVGEGNAAKLIDLSIAERKGGFKIPFFGKKKDVQGTVSYMSPEQIQNKTLDFRTDIYSFGATLYELLTGSPPFVGKTQEEILGKHLKEPVRPPKQVKPDLSPEMDRLLVRMLAKDPDDRIPDMNLVCYELGKVRRSLPIRKESLVETRVDNRRDGTRIMIRQGYVMYRISDEAQPYALPTGNKCVLINISRKGMGFFSADPLTVGHTVDLAASIPPLADALKLRGRIVFASKKQDETGFHSIGIRITMRPRDYHDRFAQLKEALDTAHGSSEDSQRLG